MLGFGLFLGTLIASLIVGLRAFRQPGAFNVVVIFLGLIAWIAAPPIFSGLLDFLIGIVSPSAVLRIVFKRQVEKLSKEREAERQRAERERKAANARTEEAHAAADAWTSDQRGWNYINRARLMHLNSQPKCFFMISENLKDIRVVEYSLDQSFITKRDFTFPVKSVHSLNIASPAVTKTRVKKVPVSIIETKRRSPVARGLVGGALLGPAGVVIGAASGLNSKASSSIHHEEITENYETLGEPQLIIGTTDPNRPVLKIKFDLSALTDDWMYRIRGAQIV